MVILSWLGRQNHVRENKMNLRSAVEYGKLYTERSVPYKPLERYPARPN